MDIAHDDREAVRAAVYRAIGDFGFSGYGMDDVDEILGMDWHDSLADEVTGAVLGGA